MLVTPPKALNVKIKTTVLEEDHCTDEHEDMMKTQIIRFLLLKMSDESLPMLVRAAGGSLPPCFRGTLNDFCW